MPISFDKHSSRRQIIELYKLQCCEEYDLLKFRITYRCSTFMILRRQQLAFDIGKKRRRRTCTLTEARSIVVLNNKNKLKETETHSYQRFNIICLSMIYKVSLSFNILQSS